MTNPELAKDPAAYRRHLDQIMGRLIRYQASLDAAGGSGAASDATGNVTVEFNGGASLESITIAPGWEQHIEAQDLVTVINETLVAARDGDGEQPQPAELSDEEVAAIRERRLQDMRKQMSVRRSDEELQKLVEDLPKQFEQMNREMDEALRHADDLKTEISDHEVEFKTESVQSENKMVSVEYSGQNIVRVAIHQSWLAGTSGIVLTECFNEIIRGLPAAIAAQEPAN